MISDLRPSDDLALLYRQLLAAGTVPSAASQLAPASIPIRRTKLPVPLTSYVARPHEEQRLRDRLAQARLLTLTGTGGCGKTRLALHCAAGLLETYPDGVWLAGLAALPAGQEESTVTRAVAGALGLVEEAQRPLNETLTAFLAPRTILLVLDNCEHVVAPAAALVDALLTACPRLQVLATSRQQLKVPGEVTCCVGSLALPPPSSGAQALPRYEAAALFLARARDTSPERLNSTEAAAAIAQICIRLDGIPLAIELAAARARLLPLATIASGLDDCCRLLTGGPRTVLPRQRTLRATLDWSYALLEERERVLLRRLAGFAGGWTLEAAEAVCSDTAVAGPAPEVPVLPAGDVLDVLAGLVDKSLVQVQHRDGTTRHRFLEPARQYAADMLTAAGEATTIRDRHLTWAVTFAERARPALTGSEQLIWLERLEAEHDNLRAALTWARERCAEEFGLRLAGAVGRFWNMRGYFTEGRRWLEGALAGTGHDARTPRALALTSAGNLAYSQGDFGQAAALYEEALVLERELGDKQRIAISLNNLGVVADSLGEYKRAVGLYGESLAVYRELGDKAGIAGALNNLGSLAECHGDCGRALALLEEASELFRVLGDIRSMAISLSNLAYAADYQGDHARAVALQEDALALSRQVADPRSVANSLTGLGAFVCRQADYGRAVAHLNESLTLQRALGNKEGIARTLVVLAEVAHRLGDEARAAGLLREGVRLSRDIGARDWLARGLEAMANVAAAGGVHRRAAVLAGAAESLRCVIGLHRPPFLAAEQEALVQRLHTALGDEAEASWHTGRVLSLDQAVDLALDEQERRTPVLA